MTKSNNPPAFPRLGEGFGNPMYEETGMTLRDYFAGQALAGMRVEKIPFKDCAEMAYRTADAMLAEREE